MRGIQRKEEKEKRVLKVGESLFFFLLFIIFFHLMISRA
jgi:hypothetical protein